jgi:hypothetical protein
VALAVCGSALNLTKDVFSIRIYPLEGHMLSQKLFSDVSIDLFASGNQLSAA